MSATEATIHLPPIRPSLGRWAAILRLDVDLTSSSRPHVMANPTISTDATGSRGHVGPGNRERRASGAFWSAAGFVALFYEPRLALVPSRGPSRPPGRPVGAGRPGWRGGAARNPGPRYGGPPAVPPNRRRPGPALGRGDVVSGPGVPGEFAPSPGGDGRG